MSDPTPGDPAHADHLTRFLLPAAGVRGVLVHLDAAWRQLSSHQDHPRAVTALLGEASAAAALFTGHAKVQGRLSVQLRGRGALRTLFAECTAAGTVRGIARLAEDAVLPASPDLRVLASDPVLAITIENPAAGGGDPARYQGLVPVESVSLAGAFEHYFQQSEQLPTRLVLAAGTDAAAGLMLQRLPGDTGDDDGWNRAGALFETLSRDELLGLPPDQLLHRLFQQEGVQVLDRRPLSFACSCSRERVAAMLEALGPEEAHAALAEDLATVVCEFCGRRYDFDRSQVDALFTDKGLQSPAPERIQ